MSSLVNWFCANLNIVVAGATAIAAAAAAIGLFFSANQSKQATRSEDFRTLVHLESLLRTMEAEYVRARMSKNQDEAEQVRTRIFNRLEMLSIAIRRSLIGRESRNVALELVIDVVAMVETEGGVEHLAQQRQGNAFNNVSWLTARYRNRIDQRKREYQ